MEELKKEDNAAYDWLVTKSPIHWSRSHFGIEVKCDMLLNNLCESFNAAIIGARDKPILSMLEDIRVYLMRRLNARRQYMERWIGEICPNAFKVLRKINMKQGRVWLIGLDCQSLRLKLCIVINM